ncbi:MAG: DUF4034 domain-containing protein, partial [Verrucomicrobiae bacterium]|nr:DUF4034 domain-containing protein [Verrucomicrobiae bacterium]
MSVSTSGPRKKAGPVEHIDSKERIAAMKLEAVTDPIEKERDIFMAEIRGAFDEKQFDKIETLASELKEGKALFRDGSWKIHALYDGLDNRFHTGDDGYLTDLETHDAWRKAYPDSVTERISLANLLVSYAWHARGSGYANTVTPEGWKLMGERLDHAAEALGEARKWGGEDIFWYFVAIKVGTGQSWEKKVFEHVMDEARKKEPTYWGILGQRAYTLLPRWFGEEGEWEAFAEEMAKVPDGLGDEAY